MEINSTHFEKNLIYIDGSLTDLGAHLIHIEMNLTNLENLSVQLDNNQKLFAAAFVSTFAIFIDQARSPITKELQSLPYFALQVI